MEVYTAGKETPMFVGTWDKESRNRDAAYYRRQIKKNRSGKVLSVKTWHEDVKS